MLIYEAKLKDENGNTDGSVTKQLTILIPTFTKSSSMLRNITDVLTLNDMKKSPHGDTAGKHRGGKGGLTKQQRKPGKRAASSGGGLPSNQFRQADVLVQLHLRLLLAQDGCFGLTGLRKAVVNRL